MKNIKGLKMYKQGEIDFTDEELYLEIHGLELDIVETITGNSYRLKFSKIVDLLDECGFGIVKLDYRRGK